MDDEKPDFTEIAEYLKNNDEVFSEILDEIKKITKNIRDGGEGIYKKKQDLIYGFFKSFHTINGLTLFLEMEVINHIGRLTERLIDYSLVQYNELPEEELNLIKRASEIIGEIIEEPNILSQDKSSLGNKERIDKNKCKKTGKIVKVERKDVKQEKINENNMLSKG
jgi:chemotaxis protein histidine kinase CheA